MDPPELIFLKNLDPRNLFFRKKVEIYGPPMKRLDPRGTYFSRQLKNKDPVELIFQTTVEKYGPCGTYFSNDS